MRSSHFGLRVEARNVAVEGDLRGVELLVL
jgi:hypothetical protein